MEGGVARSAACLAEILSGRRCVAGEFGANHRGKLGRRRGVCGREHGFESKEKIPLPLSSPCFGSGGALQLVVGGCVPDGAAVTAATPSLNNMTDPMFLLAKLCFAKKTFGILAK